MTLSQAIKSLVEAKGLSILTSPMTLNILSDYNAFNEHPSSKNILKNVISEGYLDKIAFFYDNQIPLGDAPQTYLSEMFMKLGFRKDVSAYVLNSILEALGYDGLIKLDQEECQGSSDIDEVINPSTVSSNHISFHGISLSETREEIVNKLKSKGYQVIETNNKLVELSGEYIGLDNAEIRVFGRPNSYVSEVAVNINNTFFSLYKANEEHVLSLLTKKYGEPVQAIRNYSDCDEFDGLLLFKNIDENKIEALDYKWNVKGGNIHVTTIMGSLRIDFVDEINAELSRKETAQRNLDSL